MFNFNFDLTGKFPTIYIALGLIGVNVLILNNHIKIDNDYVLLVIYFFGFVAFFYFLLFVIFNILIPLYSYWKKNKFVNNFNYLPSNQQNILWKIYFNNDERKAKMQSNDDLNYLKSNRYIKFIEKVSEKEAIYQINKKLIPFLTKKLLQQIRDDLQNLSDKEKEILNLFYDDNIKENYNNEDDEALKKLISKKIIEQRDNNLIAIPEYAKKILKQYRKEKVKNIEISFCVYLTPDIGGGSRGGDRL